MNKILITVLIPSIDEKLEVFIPVSKNIGSIIVSLKKMLAELKNPVIINQNLNLYNQTNGQIYLVEQIIKETDLRNGSLLILM